MIILEASEMNKIDAELESVLTPFLLIKKGICKLLD
jgi:hypothetical protein